MHTIDNNRSRKTRGIVAIAAGAALLLGGSTFALWTANSTAASGVITAGDLEVGITAPAWSDISADVAGTPRVIDLSTFRIIPGDTIQGVADVDAALLGDNLKAELNVNIDEATGGLAAATEGVSLTYTVLDKAGNPIAGATDIPVGTAATLTLASGTNPNADTSILVGDALDGTADLQVAVTAVFDDATPAQTRVLETLSSNLSVTLNQVR